MQRILIAVGAVLFLVGLLWPWLSRLGLGHLPGDIRIETENGFFLLSDRDLRDYLRRPVAGHLVYPSLDLLYPGKVRKSALTPFHTICAPMQTRMNAVSLNRNVHSRFADDAAQPVPHSGMRQIPRRPRAVDANQDRGPVDKQRPYAVRMISADGNRYRNRSGTDP